jgi:hypothetical protein
LENNALGEEIGLKFVNESVEPIIEFPNVFVFLFASFEEWRVKGIHAFLFTPIVLKSLFKIFRGLDAPFRETVNPVSGRKP